MFRQYKRISNSMRKLTIKDFQGNNITIETLFLILFIIHGIKKTESYTVQRYIHLFLDNCYLIFEVTSITNLILQTNLKTILN